MKSLATDRLDLIDALVAEVDIGGITAGLLEKDEHLTDALRALFAVPAEGMHLVFCGGSSLAKVHGLIERMSEDADLKIVLTPETQGLPGGIRPEPPAAHLRKHETAIFRGVFEL